MEPDVFKKIELYVKSCIDENKCSYKRDRELYVYKVLYNRKKKQIKE